MNSSRLISTEMPCAVRYHLYNLKNVKNTYGGVLLLLKLQAKSNIPPWVFSTFFKLYKWYKIAQNVSINVNVIIYGKKWQGYKNDRFYQWLQ